MSGKQEMIKISDVYKMMKDGLLIVPSYQRQFVWSEEQQQSLIQSILDGVPIGSFFISKRKDDSCYDIVDGQQRLKSIFYFIENDYKSKDGRLSQQEQETFLNYPLFFNILDLTATDIDSADVFRIINTTGEPVSAHELRRGSNTGIFSKVVEALSSALFPQINSSFDAQQNPESVSSCLWSRLGIFNEKDIHQRKDQILIAQIVFSVLTQQRLPANDEVLDRLYFPENPLFEEVEKEINAYPADRLITELSMIFDIFDSPLIVRINKTTSSCFYIVVLALHNMIICKNKPLTSTDALDAVFHTVKAFLPEELGKKEYTELFEFALSQIERFCITNNQEYPPERVEFERIMRRAQIETAGIEFKQGFLRLDDNRKEDKCLKQQIVETLCGIANARLLEPAYLYIGIADKEKDAVRIEHLDHVHPINLEGHYIVGIERETKIMNISVEEYCKRIKDFIDNSDLSRSLIVSVLPHIEVFSYKGFILVQIIIHPQKGISYLGDEVFIRKLSSTTRVTNAREIAEIALSFRN